MSQNVTEGEAIHLTVPQKSAKGEVGHAVGKAIEALQGRKAEQQIGQAGNDDRRPERYPT